jgi:predicted phage gp36 major capsid-like protein
LTRPKRRIRGGIDVILDAMRSKLAGEIKEEQRRRFARMTPAERVALAGELGEQGLAEYMSSNRVDRLTAIRAVRQSRRAGRRPSRCIDERS